MWVQLPEYELLVAVMVTFSVTFTEALKGPCSVDAATTWVGNGKMYLFKDNGYIKWNDDEDKSSEWRPLKNWHGIPNNLDAATSWGGYNYFFKGCSYWKYDKNGKIVGNVRDIRSGWKSPCNIDAAAMWRDKTYLFKGNNYVGWRGNHHWEGSIGPNWNEMEGDIDAGVKWHKNGVTYFLKGNYYWRFDGENSVIRKVHEHWNGLLDNLLKDCPCVCERCCNKKWKLYDIQYHTDAASLVKLPPVIIGKQVVDNRDGSGSPYIQFRVSKTVTETESFSNTVGASLTVGTEFKTGIPFIAEGKVSVSLTASYEHTWGTEKSVSKTRTAVYNCPAQPGKFVTCSSTLTMGRMDVPYTMTLRHEDKGCTCASKGVFKKVAVANMILDIEED